MEPGFPVLMMTGPRQSGETIASDFFGGLDCWRGNLFRESISPWLLHGALTRQERAKAMVLPWNDLSPLLEKLA